MTSKEINHKDHKKFSKKRILLSNIKKEKGPPLKPKLSGKPTITTAQPAKQNYSQPFLIRSFFAIQKQSSEIK